MTRVAVKPKLLRWACERAGQSPESIRHRFPQFDGWERGEPMPTLRQLEEFAKSVFVPIGYLFLTEPPEEPMPIPDLRTVADRQIQRPSPNLLDTIYVCQRRQDWYRDYALSVHDDPLPFVGSARIDSSVEKTAEAMRKAVGFNLDARRDCPTWAEALRQLLRQADDLGVLVMCSGVVLNNTHRKLDPAEFRGFALADDLAPLVFVNGADTRAAQMFTLAHELAHLWLGESALSDVTPDSPPRHRMERWCNEVAAEFLVPLEVLRSELPPRDPLSAVASLARRFKVSTLVILRRMFDARRVSREAFQHAYAEELARLHAVPKGPGGDFYLTEAARVSKRFARALIVTTLEGHNSFTQAFRLLGVRKMETFDEFARTLGVLV